MKEIFVVYQAFSQGGGILFGNTGFFLDDTEELSLSHIQAIQGQIKSDLIAQNKPLNSDVTVTFIKVLRTGVKPPPSPVTDAGKQPTTPGV